MISLIITTYNHAHYIREALDSVLMQDIDDLEVIVVDDGSKDGTLEIARAFEGSRFEVHSKVNGGPSSALNYGISRASGDFIVLLSGDDKMLPGSIAQRVAILRSGKASIVSSMPIWMDGDGEELPDAAHPPLFNSYAFDTASDTFRSLYYKGNMICAPSVAMTKSASEGVGPFNEDLWQLQDYEYWLRASAKNFAFHCLAEPCISYRWHEKNLSMANPTASEKELDFVLAAAPGWLDEGTLRDVVLGADASALSTEVEPEVLRAIIRLRHTRKSVQAIGSWQLRTIVQDEHNRSALLNAVF